MATLAAINSSATSATASATSHGLVIGDYFRLDGSEVLQLDGFGTSAASTDAQVPNWSQVEDRTKLIFSRAKLGTTAASHASAATITKVVPAYTERSVPVAGGFVNAGATYTTTAGDDGKTIALNHATASVVTLHTATGAGTKIRFLVTAVPSGTHKVQVTTTDILQGVVSTIDTDTAGTVTGFATAADSDTVSLNHGTQGAVTQGEWLEVEDIAAGVWAIRGQLSNTGNGATPFSAAVS